MIVSAEISRILPLTINVTPVKLIFRELIFPSNTIVPFEAEGGELDPFLPPPLVDEGKELHLTVVPPRSPNVKQGPKGAVEFISA